MSSMPPRDSRIPLRFGTLADAGTGSAFLIEGDAGRAPGCPVERFTVPALFARHPAGCPCCAPRTEVARALARLFLARTRGEIAFFHEVVAVVTSAQGQAAVRTALQADPLVSAWFRVAAAPSMGEDEPTEIIDHDPEHLRQ